MKFSYLQRVILLVTVVTTYVSALSTDVRKIMTNADSSKSFDENQIFQKLGVGSLGRVYLSPTELANLNQAIAV